MPLGSIEEWRARIGTSWCALGHPIKKHSCRLRCEGERSQRVLSLHQVVTLLIMLMLMIEVNVSLYNELGHHQTSTSKWQTQVTMTYHYTIFKW